MVKTSRDILCLLYAIAAVLVFTGCTNAKREMNELGIVLITAVDIDQEDGLFEITVNCLKSVPGGIGGTGGEVGKGQIASWTASAKGETIMMASKNLRERATADLSWLHSEIIIIGRNAAEKGLDKVLDFFSRNREIRLISYVYICESPASEIMKLTPEVSSNMFSDIKGITQNQIEWGKTSIPMLYMVLDRLESKGGDPIVARLVSVKPEPFEEQPIDKAGNFKASDNVVALNGTAVIKDNKFAGWLNGIETRGYRWATDEKKSSFVVSMPFEDGGMQPTSIELMIRKTETSVELEDENSLKFKINIDLRGDIRELSADLDLAKKDVYKKLEEDVAKKVENEIRIMLDKVQKQYKADILSLGELVYRKYPWYWNSIQDYWADRIYPYVPVEIDVKCVIDRTGMTG